MDCKTLFIARILAVLVLAGASAARADPVCPPEDPNVEYSSTEYKNGCPVIVKDHRQPKRPSSPEPEDSCPTRGSSRIDVEAMVQNPTAPTSDLKLGVQELEQIAKDLDPKAAERLGGGKHLLGLTVHLDGEKPTNYPFNRFHASFLVERSRQGKHQCVSVSGIQLEYAPLHVYVAREMFKCEDVLAAHERQHYAYHENLDIGLAASLSSRFNGLGLPTPAQPKMVRTQTDIDIIKKASRVKIRDELASVEKGRYRELASMQQQQLDTRAEMVRLCSKCDERGAPFCRSAIFR